METGIRSQDMRLMVGHNEFSGLLSQMDFEAAVTEVDDSVAQTDDMEYLPGQISRTATASGRWTAAVGGIDQFVGANTDKKSFVAMSENGINYKVGTATKTSHTQTQSAWLPCQRVLCHPVGGDGLRTGYGVFQGFVRYIGSHHDADRRGFRSWSSAVVGAPYDIPVLLQHIGIRRADAGADSAQHDGDRWLVEC